MNISLSFAGCLIIEIGKGKVILFMMNQRNLPNGLYATTNSLVKDHGNSEVPAWGHSRIGSTSVYFFLLLTCIWGGSGKSMNCAKMQLKLAHRCQIANSFYQWHYLKKLIAAYSNFTGSFRGRELEMKFAIFCIQKNLLHFLYIFICKLDFL